MDILIGIDGCMLMHILLAGQHLPTGCLMIMFAIIIMDSRRGNVSMVAHNQPPIYTYAQLFNLHLSFAIIN